MKWLNFLCTISVSLYLHDPCSLTWKILEDDDVMIGSLHVNGLFLELTVESYRFNLLFPHISLLMKDCTHVLFWKREFWKKNISKFKRLICIKSEQVQMILKQQKHLFFLQRCVGLYIDRKRSFKKVAPCNFSKKEALKVDLWIFYHVNSVTVYGFLVFKALTFVLGTEVPLLSV